MAPSLSIHNTMTNNLNPPTQKMSSDTSSSNKKNATDNSLTTPRNVIFHIHHISKLPDSLLNQSLGPSNGASSPSATTGTKTSSRFHLQLSIHSNKSDETKSFSIASVPPSAQKRQKSSNDKVLFHHDKVIFPQIQVQYAYKLKISLLDQYNDKWCSCKLDIRKIIKEANANGRKLLKINVPMTKVQGVKPLISLTYVNTELSNKEQENDNNTAAIRQDSSKQEEDSQPNKSLPSDKGNSSSIQREERNSSSVAEENETSPQKKPEPPSRADSLASGLQLNRHSNDLNISNILDELEKLNSFNESDEEDEDLPTIDSAVTPRSQNVDDLISNDEVKEEERIVDSPPPSPKPASPTEPVNSDQPQNQETPRESDSQNVHDEPSLNNSPPSEKVMDSPKQQKISSNHTPNPPAQNEDFTASQMDTLSDMDLIEQNTRNEILIQDLRQEVHNMKTKMRMLQQESEHASLFELYEEDIMKLQDENQALLKENQEVSLKYQRDLLHKHSSNESLAFYVHNHYKTLKQENQQLKLKLYNQMKDNRVQPPLLRTNSTDSRLSISSQQSPSSKNSLYREGNTVLRRKVQQLTEQLDETRLQLERKRAECNRLHTKLRRYTQGMADANSNLRPYKQKIEQLKEKLSTLRHTMKRTSVENDTLRKELLTTQQNLLESSDQYESLQSHMENILQRTQALEEEKDEHRAQLSSLEGQLNDSMMRYEELHDSKRPEALIQQSRKYEVILPGERREVNAQFAKLARLLEHENPQALYSLEQLRDLFLDLEHELLDIRANETSYIELLMEYKYRLHSLEASGIAVEPQKSSGTRHEREVGSRKVTKDRRKRRTSRSKSVPKRK